MVFHVVKVSSGGGAGNYSAFEDYLNQHIADGTSFCAPFYDGVEQKPDHDGVHLLCNGMWLVHNSAHAVIMASDEAELRSFVEQMKDVINPQSTVWLTMDTSRRNPNGVINAAPRGY